MPKGQQTQNAAAFRPEGAKQAGLTREGRVYVQTVWEDGMEMVEEYDPRSDTLLVRKVRKATLVGGAGQWTFEVGEDHSPSRHEAVSGGVMSVSSANPIFLRLDSPEAFEWRVRNLSWPSDVYQVSIDSETRQIVIRTTNKKFFKRFGIGEMDALGLALEEGSLSFSYANTTLLVQYRKPCVVLDYEKDKASERGLLLEKAKEDGAVDNKGPMAQPGEFQPGQPPNGGGDCKQQ